jgi:predicted nuclease of restriction endonuclease-like (RecB) superfamily
MSGFSVNNLFRIKQFYIYYSKASFSEQLVPQTEIQLTSILEQDVSKLQNAEIQNDTKVAQVAPQLPATEKQELTISTQVVQNFLSIPWGHHILIMQKVKDTEEALFYVQKTLENNWSRAVLEYQIETNLYSRQGKAVTNFSLTLPQPESDLANEMMKEPYNFDFIRLINRLVKDDSDKPTIGILLCKNKNNYVVDFSLSNVSNPIGVSTFHYTELAEDIKAALPSAEMLQNELINFERQHYGKK